MQSDAVRTKHFRGAIQQISVRCTIFQSTVNLIPYDGIQLDTRDNFMAWTGWEELGGWLQAAEPVLSLVAGVVSAAILLGCAVTSWIAPSEKKDCLFHREVV